MIKKYRKKPVEVEAIQFTGTLEHIEEIQLFVGDEYTVQSSETFIDPFGGQYSSVEESFSDTSGYLSSDEGLNIYRMNHYHEGALFLAVNHFLIRGENGIQKKRGEFITMAPDVFKKTYEEVEG